MTLQFYLNYKTKYGEEIYLISDELTHLTGKDRHTMKYENEDYWTWSIELPKSFKKTINYYYLVRNIDGYNIYDGETARSVVTADIDPKKGSCRITDTWVGTNNLKNIFYTAPFDAAAPKVKTRLAKGFTHEFKVKAPLLSDEETVCILGSTPHLHLWDDQKPILMKYQKGWYIARISMKENEWPVTYKYAVYNTNTKEISHWESGENRHLPEWNTKSGTSMINDGYVRIETPTPRKAGINVPVFSIRTKNGFGTGEFADLKMLVDWCVHTGLKVIQLLPVNDTTISGDWHDSYPYAPVSAFALHPLYINLEKVAGKKNAALIKKLNKKKKQLNDLDVLDYEQVMEFKINMLKELFALQKKDLKSDKQFDKFLKNNKEWLQPYAAFCYQRDKNKTADFTSWKSYKVYHEASVKRLVSPKSKDYDQILFHYYVQYHLDQQLKEAADYAHQKGVALKGDLPIGLHKNSCDVWMYPELFDVTQQAGAPPDAFTTKGQNWGFPVYRWEEMKKNNYQWWQKRLSHLSNYFDAYRVDHILGFFRIWSVPEEQQEGLLGRFIPANPVYYAEFQQDRIYFDYERYCHPYITDDILKDVFGKDASTVKKKLLIKKEDGTYQLKEVVDTQVKAAQYLEKHKMQEFREGIFSLLTNVILIEEKGSEKQQFHFRIGMDQTASFRALDAYLQDQLRWLYHDYFHQRQDSLWSHNAMEKLPAIQRSTDMLMCAEDLGWVPESVPRIMNYLNIPGLKSERITPDLGTEFFDLGHSPYLSIAQPGTHDMSTLRAWWQQDKEKTQRYFQQVLGEQGDAPAELTPEMAKKVISRYLNAPAFWSIFLLQDLLAISKKYRTENPEDERINVPSEKYHYWRYRIKLPLEDLVKDKELKQSIHQLLQESDRL